LPADRRPDKGEEFIVGRWPNSRLIVASPCSGHGAKFASAIGEKLARLAIDPAYEVEPFFPAIPILCFRLIGPLSLVPRAEACLRAIVDDVQNGRAQCADSDRADPHARERAFERVPREEPPSDVSPQAAAVAIAEVLDSIGDTCPECPPQ
jgi:hypothetical protein